MKNFTTLLAAASVATLALLTPAAAQSFNDAQKKEIETLVRDYLLNNPELLREMAGKLEEKDRLAEDEQRSKAMVANKDAVYKSAGDAMVGNPKGDVTIVEFMDYNCGWCKKSMGEIAGLLKSDPNLKVVFKEFPIFGEHSEYAAKAALAANKQGKYWELHQAMFSHEGQVTKDVVDQLAEANGLDVAKMKADIESPDLNNKIAANLELGKSLAINGTPAFVIDAKVVGGYLPLDGMMQEIAAVRANGCKMC
jgi:protein-disulfide isomerase